MTLIAQVVAKVMQFDTANRNKTVTGGWLLAFGVLNLQNEIEISNTR